MEDIENFAISGKILYEVLKAKGVNFLFHANTVLTSITFIEQGALLTRHYVEINSLQQTEQKSDDEDRKFDVWDHFFLDGQDLHKLYRKANKYGPVLFVLNLEMLNCPDFSSIYVTKTNPWYWNESMTLDDKFYKDPDDIVNDYLTGKKLDSRIMFTIRNPEKKIKLNKYLHSICLDKPDFLIKTKLGEVALSKYLHSKFSSLLNSNGLSHITLFTRHQRLFYPCLCCVEYFKMYNFQREEFIKRFSYLSK